MIDDNIKLKYMELKCIHDPDQVTHALEIYNFPLNEALKICNKHKNYFASAFIKFRIGAKEQAIDEYLKVSLTQNNEFLTIFRSWITATKNI